MSSASPAVCESPGVAAPLSERSAWALRLSDYLTLTKPRIAVLALVTVSAGYFLGSADVWRLEPLLHALFGIALVAAGSSALNQFFERDTDARMPRTAGRPLPAGRMHPGEALGFGVVTGLGGAAYLAVQVNWSTAALAAATCLLYAVVYTPLKRRTTFSTAIGAIPGAFPPVLGWVASGASLDQGAFGLFAIMFLWQFPHFLAIAWIYLEEYARAGLKMLPALGRAPRLTGMMAVAYALALLPLSLYPSISGLAGGVYGIVAVALGILYLFAAVCFAISESRTTARRLLLTSLAYLPLLLLALVWDHWRLLL
jgi:heme o synthase